MTEMASIDPWIAEIPHHGSATPVTARLMLSNPRTLWVQSTGRRRPEPDSLGALIKEIKVIKEIDTITTSDVDRSLDPNRLITARDGAIHDRTT